VVVATTTTTATTATTTIRTYRGGNRAAEAAYQREAGQANGRCDSQPSVS
jgi:hypothetical protein